jgi:hypothetical protein
MDGRERSTYLRPVGLCVRGDVVYKEAAAKEDGDFEIV